MTRSDRLFRLLQLLHDGQCHRAKDLAAALGVSQRSIYRDMETLAAAGQPVTGTRGTGYRLADHVALPPLLLSAAEVEALNLGIAIVAESADPGLSAAANALADKIDAALPQSATAPSDGWKSATLPAASAARGFSHLPVLRAAIGARQKLRVVLAYSPAPRVLRPLRLENWGRSWILTGWCETTGGFAELRTDMIAEAEPLPVLFADEPGKALADFARA